MDDFVSPSHDSLHIAGKKLIDCVVCEKKKKKKIDFFSVRLMALIAITVSPVHILRPH